MALTEKVRMETVRLDAEGLHIDGTLVFPAYTLGPDISVQKLRGSGPEEHAITVTFHAERFELHMSDVVRADIITGRG